MNTSELTDILVAEVRSENSENFGRSRTPESRVVSNLTNACEVLGHCCIADLRNMYKKSNVRGYSATAFGVQVMTYAICGRIMITLRPDDQSSNDFITLVGGEDPEDGSPGLHGINCDPDAALDMLYIVTHKWFRFYDGRRGRVETIFKPNSNISML